MSHLKRKADGPLLPLRAPKQPRTAFLGYDGANAGPSNLMGVLSKWMASVGEIMESGLNAVRDLSLLPPEESQPVRQANGDARVPQANGHATRPSAPGPSRQAAPTRPVQIPPPPCAPPKSLRPLPASSSQRDAARMPPPPVPNGLRPSTSLPSSSSGSSSTSSSLSSNPAPADVRIAKALEERRRRNELEKQGVARLYEDRPHIYAKQHKQRVREATQLDFEKTRKEIFDIKRRSGYSSSEEEFKKYLDYKEAVNRIYNRDLLAPSPSVPNLRAYYAKDEARRRSDTFSEDFLRRELQRARAALAEPKPIPFTPSYEQQERWKRERDERINARLRPKRPPLPAALPPEDEALVDQLLRKRGVVAKFAREQVSDTDLSRLRPGQWLNDEVINFYGAMILGRAEAASKGKEKENERREGKGKRPLDIHYFNSFFWSKLVNEGYEKGRLARWTKKIDIFSKDAIILPVNHSNTHWTSAAINFRKKRIEYYDSLGSKSPMVYRHLRAYLDAESRNKKKKPFDFTGWEDYFDENAPQQENAFDCGVFSCQFMEAISRGEETFNFEQKNMPYLRRRMVWEIGNGRFKDDH